MIPLTFIVWTKIQWKSMGSKTIWLPAFLCSSADPRLLGALCRTWGGGMKESMQRICLFHSISNRDRGKRSSLLRLRTLSTRFVFSRARDCTIFTFQNLTDFYEERVTAHRIKINDHSCFHILWPNFKTKLKLKHLWGQGGSLVFRGPYAACVFCV